MRTMAPLSRCGRGFLLRSGRRSCTAAPPTLTTTALRASPVSLPSPTTTRSITTSAPRLIAPSHPRRAPPPVRFTVDAYPQITRDPRFARLSDKDVTFFTGLLGPSGVLDATNLSSSSSSSSKTTPEDLDPFNTDWMRKYRGQSRLVLKPESTDQVSQILRYCHEHLLAVVPQGGNTGLVGGSVPVFDEVIINTSRMNRIIAFDDVSGDLVVGAGVILEVAEQFLAERGYTFPLDLGAKGSCQIGGNISTNAGGLRLLRYGNLHGSVLGVEAVLPDGTVVDDLSRLRKNNTGYDLKQLFIGAEGTLGIVTKVSIQCAQKSPAVNVAFFGLESFDRARQAFREAKSHLSEILSAFEMMDATSQQLVHRVRPSDRPPLGSPSDHPFYCLVETRGSNSEHDYAKLETFLEDVMGKEVVADGVLAQDETQARALWGWREGVPECLGHWGGVYKYDVSVHLADMYTLVEDTRKRLEDASLVGDTDEFPVVATAGYGHMGDSNLHLNVAVRGYADKRVEKALEPFVYEWIAKRGGSISAEHGLGLAKREHIGYSRDKTAIDLMRRIKDLFDPRGIMNPYKYI